MIKGLSTMRRLIAAAFLALAGVGARAEGFDYYLLALSWSPSWCEAEGAATGAEQCRPERDFGFVLHGLWPQHETGWPEYCDTAARDPDRAETAAMADVMGSGGLAWAQWKKHGRCTGLEPEEYFALSRRAFQAFRLPEPEARTDAASVAAAFRAANPGVPADGIAVTCRAGLLREVRVCLTPELAPRSCGADVLEDACRGNRTLAAPEAP
jgi:ribonuclease T2